MNKDGIIWYALTIILIGMFAFAITEPRAEERSMEKDCYMNMPQEQVVVCLGSIKAAVEEITEQTKQLLKEVKPINAES